MNGKSNASYFFAPSGPNFAIEAASICTAPKDGYVVILPLRSACCFARARVLTQF
jgi:hypothetical protein